MDEVVQSFLDDPAAFDPTELSPHDQLLYAIGTTDGLTLVRKFSRRHILDYIEAGDLQRADGAAALALDVIDFQRAAIIKVEDILTKLQEE